MKVDESFYNFFLYFYFFIEKTLNSTMNNSKQFVLRKNLYLKQEVAIRK